MISIFGGPGTGKSTLCANLFARMKMYGIDVEMAPEYVKEVVWEESFKKIENQLYIFGKQHQRTHRLTGKVDVIITDSPLLNSIVYYTGNNPHFSELVLWEYNKMNNLAFYLERSFEYVQNGRTQSLENAKKVDEIYESILLDNNVEHTTLTSPYDIDMILEAIKERL